MREGPPSVRRPSRNAPLSRVAPRPRRRRSRSRCRQRSHAQESSCRGGSRRLIVRAIEKLMDDLQIVNDASLGPPDHGGRLMAPVVVPLAADAVAGQIEGGAALPVGPKNGLHPPSFAGWPAVEGQRRVAIEVPKPARGSQGGIV